jgi:hypothetical protein
MAVRGHARECCFPPAVVYLSFKSLSTVFRHLMRLLRSASRGLPTSFGGFRGFRCLGSPKLHKPRQFERTHVSFASLQQRFVCHLSRFRVCFDRSDATFALGLTWARFPPHLEVFVVLGVLTVQNSTNHGLSGART